ncbi:TrkA C-terminal domain-containing protein [bacterium]|nr:TrkA C-terminal domain-containing protein [bacterium]
MSLWEKIKSGLEEGLETLSQKSSEMSRLARMKWDRRAIQKKIHDELIVLGTLVVETSGTKKEKDLAASVSENIDKIAGLEKQLQDKEKEIREFTEKIEGRQVKDLKKDLDMGDGTIDQIRITEKSPLAGKKLMEIELPKQVLVGTVVRGEEVIFPDGLTILNAGDKLTLIGKKEDVQSVIRKYQ